MSTPGAAKVFWLRPACAAGRPALRPCDAPVIEGDPGRLGRVLTALHGLPGPDLLEAHLVHRLSVGPDEAEIVLGFAPEGDEQRSWADGAFRALRDALPDTDVYVAHAA